MTLKGITTEDPKPVKELQERFVEDGHYMVEPKFMARNTGPDRTRFQQEFTAHIDIEKQNPEKYERRLAAEEDGNGDTRSRNGDNRKSDRRRGNNGRPRRGGRQ